VKPINNFSCEKKVPEDFVFPYTGQEKLLVIEALDGQLITNKLVVNPRCKMKTL
jgi:adenine deaminase